MMPSKTTFTFLAFFIGVLFFFAPSHSQAQDLDAKYGLRVGGALYQPRLGIANRPPRMGFTVGGNANFAIDQKGLIRLMPEFGYILGNTRDEVTQFNQQNYVSNMSGTPFAIGTEIKVLSHFLQGGLMLKAVNNSNENFGVYIGPALHYWVNQTIVFEQPVQGQLDPVQESMGGMPDNVDRWYFNFYIGAEAKFSAPSSNSNVYGYIQTIHQANQDPHLPTGMVFGIKVLW